MFSSISRTSFEESKNLEFWTPAPSGKAFSKLEPSSPSQITPLIKKLRKLRCTGSPRRLNKFTHVRPFWIFLISLSSEEQNKKATKNYNNMSSFKRQKAEQVAEKHTEERLGDFSSFKKELETPPCSEFCLESENEESTSTGNNYSISPPVYSPILGSVNFESLSLFRRMPTAKIDVPLCLMQYCQAPRP